MVKISISIESGRVAGRQSLSEYLDDRKCDGCILGCTGGCSTCDVLDECEVCTMSSCSKCDVKEQCYTCRCNGCDGCPYLNE